MSEKPPPKRRISGQVAAQAYREKYESITENTLPMLQDLNERIGRALEQARRSSSIPPKDEEEGPPTPKCAQAPTVHAPSDLRREPGDDAPPPVDIIQAPRPRVPRPEKKS